jgi:hypothetical protein
MRPTPPEARCTLSTETPASLEISRYDMPLERSSSTAGCASIEETNGSGDSTNLIEETQVRHRVTAVDKLGVRADNPALPRLRKLNAAISSYLYVAPGVNRGFIRSMLPDQPAFAHARSSRPRLITEGRRATSLKIKADCASAPEHSRGASRRPPRQGRTLPEFHGLGWEARSSRISSTSCARSSVPRPGFAISEPNPTSCGQTGAVTISVPVGS